MNKQPQIITFMNMQNMNKYKYRLVHTIYGFHWLLYAFTNFVDNYQYNNSFFNQRNNNMFKKNIYKYLKFKISNIDSFMKRLHRQSEENQCKAISIQIL